MKFFINTTQILEDETRSNEEWGSWSSQYSFQVESATINDKFKLDYKIESEGYALPVKPGDEVFVLTIRYGSGDSFGHASGKGEVIWTYSSLESALIAEKQYLNAITEQEYSFDMLVELEDGTLKTTTIGNIVNGHFDTFESLQVESLTLE